MHAPTYDSTGLDITFRINSTRSSGSVQTTSAIESYDIVACLLPRIESLWLYLHACAGNIASTCGRFTHAYTHVSTVATCQHPISLIAPVGLGLGVVGCLPYPSLDNNLQVGAQIVNLEDDRGHPCCFNNGFASFLDFAVVRTVIHSCIISHDGIHTLYPPPSCCLVDVCHPCSVCRGVDAWLR
jgi:hypothetical protein